MKDYFPGWEPDADVRSELRFINGILDLRQFEKIFISVSGGKDSQAMLFLICEMAERQGVPRGNLLAVYADTGLEWHNTEEHVRKLCGVANVPFEVVRPIRPMIEKIRFRMKRIKTIHGSGNPFPSASCRWCTSEQKIHPIDKIINQYSGQLLKVTGERWEESSARSTLVEFCMLPRVTCSKRKVYGWRPMLEFREADVWAIVKDSGVDRHICYDMGCPRLGCAGCIFNDDRQVKIEMRENPHIFEAIDRLEIETGYTMSMRQVRIRDRVKKG